jgi:hypothetical protein
MSEDHRATSDDVEQLMLNARLRDELEPFIDESLEVLDRRHMSTPLENEYLASILAWERAPVLAISKWFEPELVLPHPEMLSDAELHGLLWETLHRLYDKRIVLEFTDHLSDRQLYCLLIRDILPSPEKKIDVPKNYLHWHCLDRDEDPDTWLRYYASEEEREGWREETGLQLPPMQSPPYPRVIPRRC